MTRDSKTPEGRIERLLEQLPEEKPLQVDLWTGIESAIAESPVWAQAPREIEPGEDLWPAIESRILHQRRSRFSGWRVADMPVSLLAACLAVVAITGFGVFEFYRSAGPVEEIAGAGDFYLPAALSGPGIEAQATYRDNIALVQQQRSLIEASLETYPMDPNLRKLWRHAYETELKLIDAAGRSLSTI